MAKGKNNPMWVEAKKKCRLNAATIQMAKEMGLNPKSLIKNIPNKNQQWKEPVHVWIQDMYEDKFGEVKLKETIKKYKGVKI
jgi:phage terminase small subunit